MKGKFTPARLRGLRAVANAQSPNGARVSNHTDVDHGYVYWQSADWLHTNGFIEVSLDYIGERAKITDAGRAVLQGAAS